MSTYTAPMKDMQFVLHELAGLDAIARLPGYGDVSTELVDAVLEGAATFSSEVWGPLNKVGDLQGLKRHDDGRVTTPKGFVEAYAKFVESGWNGLRFDPAFGGQGVSGTGVSGPLPLRKVATLSVTSRAMAPRV